MLAAGEGELPQAAEALEKLCRTYWYPLYVYVRRQGNSPEDAQDLTQNFFSRLLEKNYFAKADRDRGMFRTFLLGSLKNFLVNEWKRTGRLKRGGRVEFLSIDAIILPSSGAICPGSAMHWEATCRLPTVMRTTGAGGGPTSKADCRP